MNNFSSLPIVKAYLKRAVCCVFCLSGALFSPLFGQNPIDDFMRHTGKINVVVSVLAVIFLLIIGYLISLDRKIRKLENNLPNDKNQ